MTLAQKLARSAMHRARYRTDIEANRARARVRKQRILIERAIENARIELHSIFNVSPVAT